MKDDCRPRKKVKDMVVEVRLFATFRKGRFKKSEVEVAEGGSVRDLLKHLKIGEKEVGILLVNGGSGSIESKLAANDVVSILPLIGGG